MGNTDMTLGPAPHLDTSPSASPWAPSKPSCRVRPPCSTHSTPLRPGWFVPSLASCGLWIRHPLTHSGPAWRHLLLESGLRPLLVPWVLADPPGGLGGGGEWCAWGRGQTLLRVQESEPLDFSHTPQLGSQPCTNHQGNKG